MVARIKGIGYPSSFIEGIMIDPMAATVAGAEPEMAPKNAQARKETTARPPGSQPTRERARLTSRLETPPVSIRLPARIKKGTAIIE
jgi:hypothetical protein